ncbi:alcohol dehydrogenase [Penicillium brevicompactum]|uniref:Alcohol dehydrogenase n=1 Tax=Penicillium brevicompactum TaxID=5074 RepID=A0A9W9V531_PENBR|nr:alcohol dehydrogenase [Penicillium brevicompactum]
MTFTNEAAWQTAPDSKTFELGPGPTPNPSEDEVVIKVAYAAVNPLQESPFDLPYPYIFGTDIAGTIVQLGSNVTRFQLGQRVIGHCDGLLTQKKPNNGFQRYATTREILVSAIPDKIPLSNAAVLPLSVSTAAGALFHYLALPYPTLTPTPLNKKILIWGGSSAVGSSAIQLARAAGLEVLATASQANFEYVQSLGATAFDYHDPNIVERVLEVLREGDVVFDVISSSETQEACGEILRRIGGVKLLTTSPALQVGVPEGIEGVFVNGLAPGLIDLNVGDAVWRKYLPEALEAGVFAAKPDALVIEGLERVQEGVDILKKGVSARKIVIEVERE